MFELHPLILLLFALWALALAKAVTNVWMGIRFVRYVRASLHRQIDAAGLPPAVIILPCCGVDDKLARTVEALGRQDYPDYEVIFTFESSRDPAYEAVGRWASQWGDLSWWRVVAGPAQNRSQKIQNLLAALNAVSNDRQVLAFLDSDAVPRSDWLARLVSPLSEPGVGAATGFRWYSSERSLAEGVRSAWNAATVSFMHDPALNFCWGGSTAIRRDVFERCRIAVRWQGALSDDYQVTRGVRDAGLAIRFVPQCLIPCHEPTSFRAFLGFARRQLIITRVCAPKLWRAGLFLAARFMLGTSCMFGLALYAWWMQRYTLLAFAVAAWLILLLLAKANSALRQWGVSMVLSKPDWTWRDWAHDVVNSELLGTIHLLLLLSTGRTRRILWRDWEYEMVSPDQTRIIRRPTG